MAKKWSTIADRRSRSPITSSWGIWGNHEANKNCSPGSEDQFPFFTWFPQMNRLVARAQKLKPKIYCQLKRLSKGILYTSSSKPLLAAQRLYMSKCCSLSSTDCSSHQLTKSQQPDHIGEEMLISDMLLELKKTDHLITYWGRNFYFRHVSYQLMSNIGQMWKVCLFVCWNRSAGIAMTKVPVTQQL